MVRLIGLLLTVSSLLALTVGAFVDLKYGSSTELTGNVVFNIIEQPQINLNLFDYIAAIAFSYSIGSFIMGVLFLVKV